MKSFKFYILLGFPCDPASNEAPEVPLCQRTNQRSSYNTYNDVTRWRYKIKLMALGHSPGNFCKVTDIVTGYTSDGQDAESRAVSVDW